MNHDVLRVENLTKTFGSVIANDCISLSIKKGEILALLGENGSGKSTLMNQLSGIYQPDSGSIFYNNEKVEIRTPHDALVYKIGMIHQHFKLVDVMTAKENILIGEKKIKNAKKDILDLMNTYGLHVPIDKYVQDMAVSEKQTLEIIKVLYSGATTLILDEPTAVLTPQEIEKLFDILRNMKKKGQSIVIITHKLNEVMNISDRVSVLRKGKHVGTVNTNETNPMQLTELMVGKKINMDLDRPFYKNKQVILECNDITVENSEKTKKLKNIKFELYSGEILGVAGIANSGQKELCEVLAGLEKTISGKATYKGVDILGKSPRDIFKMGISMSFIPEDRLGMGLVAEMDMVDNLMLKDYFISKGIFVDRTPVKEKARNLIKKLSIATPGISHPVKKLSGGNIQKVLLGRELEANPNVLITAYPVRGLDIGSSMTIFNEMNKQKMNGVGVIFVGEDLDMLIGLCDRIMVLCHGEIAGIVDAKTVSKENLGLLMTGEVVKDA